MAELMTLKERGRDHIADYLRLVDCAFIAEKSRFGSLSQRYPRLFQPDNLQNLYGAWLNNELIATTVVKEVTARAGEHTVRMAFVGLVSVRIDKRGSGIGSQIIAGVTRNLMQRNFDTAVLWTTSSAFYQRFTWVPCDTGVFGRIAGLRRSDSPLPPLKPYDCVQQIEGIRNCWLQTMIERQNDDYLTVPTSADSVACFLAGEGSTKSAYALVGIQNHTGFVYEIAGCPSKFDLLWTSLCRSFDTLFLNDRIGSTSLNWLKMNTHVVWTAQSLAMCLNLPQGAGLRSKFEYVPFYDRI
jgi:predicted N-acetyltransferase YhbS